MAGIAGIISRKPQSEKDDFTRSFASMMKKMSFSDAQLQKTFVGANICFGNCVPVSCKLNDHFQHNRELGIYAVIDGLVFIDSHERSKLVREFGIDGNRPDCSLIPFLYRLYKEDFVSHVTGWFNVFIYDEKDKRSLLINDRLGFLPLYYYVSDSWFVFASKIEAVLASGILPSITPDESTVAEHLFFNYPISDATYIEDIRTLSNAESFYFQQGVFKKATYWSISQLYDYAPAGKNESFCLMDEGLKLATGKALSLSKERINLSLTGGWDSRVVLSYLLPQYKDMLNAYSFGADNAADILVPGHISAAERIDYTPYVLDRNYLEHLFIPNAIKTIMLSNGTRNYKRTHYLYAVQEISEISDILVTGIFGDQVFKAGRPNGGEVLSQNMIDLLLSDFDIDGTLKRFTESNILGHFNSDHEKLTEAFKARIETLKHEMKQFESISQKYYAFRFEYNLRKFFGNEVNSYNDFVFCFSPFIDYDFLDNFARTRYFGIHYSSHSNSIRLKKQSTKLYHDIVSANYKPLAAYNSERGYSMKDANNISGNLKILYQKYFRKQKSIDSFNTNQTDPLFQSFLAEQDCNPGFLKMTEGNKAAAVNSNTLSLLYWLGSIENEYIKR